MEFTVESFILVFYIVVLLLLCIFMYFKNIEFLKVSKDVFNLKNRIHFLVKMEEDFKLHRNEEEILEKIWKGKFQYLNEEIEKLKIKDKIEKGKEQL